MVLVDQETQARLWADCTDYKGPLGTLPVLTVLRGQCPVKLLYHAAGGQWPMDSGEMRGPCGGGKLSSESRLVVLHAGALEKRSLSWGGAITYTSITLHTGAKALRKM